MICLLVWLGVMMHVGA
uniref:Uncharacterized protein n=1 Tax=Anguilla anguilla TaxID=7936 RepID=A0A0E9P548_ANGAN